jgi:DNA-binding transcriptional regulator YbjK
MAAPRVVRRTSPRGTERRQHLTAAAGELVMEQGFGAVSHRAVAQRAGLPLAATTYYFASLEDLLAEAVGDLTDSWLAAARGVVDALPEHLDGPRAVAEAVLHVAALVPGGGTGTDPGALLSLYERYVESARHEGLRPLIAAYDAGIDGLLVDVLRRAGAPAAPDAARLLLAVADGALLRALAEGRPPEAAVDAVEGVARLLSAHGQHTAGER